MLGRRKTQTSFFDAIRLPHPVSPDSFYGRMGSLSDQMFHDEDLAELYCADNGRPSLPAQAGLPPSLMVGDCPTMMSGVTLLPKAYSAVFRRW